MLDFLETATAICTLYEHVKEELTEDDFWPLTQEQYEKLPLQERSKEWFMINPSKLRSQAKEIWIVDDNEKDTVLRAIRLIRKSTEELPDNSAFLERLLYAKKRLPPILFTPKS